jgi:hypothetical protein
MYQILFQYIFQQQKTTNIWNKNELKPKALLTAFSIQHPASANTPWCKITAFFGFELAFGPFLP